MATLLREALADLGGGPVTMPALARAALDRDATRALAVCFKPEALDVITTTNGQVQWDLVRPAHYRSSTFFQYKSLLRHAGIIAPHPLGGASAHSYNPDADRWELRYPISQ